MKTIKTVWEAATYDVWGNAKDGYEVNDVYRQSQPYEIECEVKTYNVGTPQQFDSARPTDAQIKKALGLRCSIDTDGDDTTIYINRSRDAYPITELRCVSHDALSPIREKSTIHA